MSDERDPTGVEEEAQFPGGEERAHARNSDPSTSHEAAASVVKITEKQQAVLYLFQHAGPMHDERLVPIYQAAASTWDNIPPQTDSGIRSRRSELVRKGFLVKTGRKTRTKANRRADIYAVCTPPPQHGRSASVIAVDEVTAMGLPLTQLSLLDG